jgi:hypothetical protein
LRNDKNFEATLNQFLSGNIPKDEYKVVFLPSTPAAETIDTSSKKAGKDSDLLQQYMLGSFEGSKARKNKNKKYYEEHMKAIELQKQQEAEDEAEVRKKMLHLANIMQYEDDFDDQNFYSNKNRKQLAKQADSSDEDAESGKKKPEERKVIQQRDGGGAAVDDDEEEDDDLDIDQKIERQESAVASKMDYQFQEEDRPKGRGAQQMNPQGQRPP